MTYRPVIEQQQINRFQRATKRPGYADHVADNLFLGHGYPDTGMNRETYTEFGAADGGELKAGRSKPSKMCALASSSALAVNVFDYWRHLDSAPVAGALGLKQRITSMRFEYQAALRRYPGGSHSPNLDLLFQLDDGSRVAIESKFAEPYSAKADGPLLSSRYFKDSRRLWIEQDLKRAQGLADSLRRPWETLDAAQLLKHCLGLAIDARSGTTGVPEIPTTLLYVWYDCGEEEAAGHRAEISRFAAAIAGDRIAFRHLTYQEMWKSLRPHLGPEHEKYATYMTARYFSPAA
jgi:hypothetical protein